MGPQGTLAAPQNLPEAALHSGRNRPLYLGSAMTAKEIANRAHGRRSGKGYNGHCPAHEDQNESLSISTGTDGRVLLHCHAGCEVESIVAALGLKMADLFPSKETQPHPKSKPQATCYDYCNAEGTLLYQACRFTWKAIPAKASRWQGWLEMEPRRRRACSLPSATGSGGRCGLHRGR